MLYAQSTITVISGRVRERERERDREREREKEREGERKSADLGERFYRTDIPGVQRHRLRVGCTGARTVRTPKIHQAIRLKQMDHYIKPNYKNKHVLLMTNTSKPN